MEGPKGQAKTGSDLSSSSSSVHGNMRVHADSLGSRGEAALKEPRVAARSSRIRTEECTGEACPLIGSIEDLRRPVREETKGKGLRPHPRTTACWVLKARPLPSFQSSVVVQGTMMNLLSRRTPWGSPFYCRTVFPNLFFSYTLSEGKGVKKGYKSWSRTH